MVRGEGAVEVRGVTAEEAFDFVLDPAQYTKADTKIVWVTELAPTHDGMIAREDGTFLGHFPGSVITRYRWHRPDHIDVTLEQVSRRLSTPGSTSRRPLAVPGSTTWRSSSWGGGQWVAARSGGRTVVRPFGPPGGG